MLRKFFHHWERSIFGDDADDRRPQAFGWGLENLEGVELEGTGYQLVEVAAELCAASENFYRTKEITRVTFDGTRLAFDSPFPSPDIEVQRVTARLFESSAAEGRAIVVVPQWNADEGSMVQACNILNYFGFSALRMTLPYHEERRPGYMVRADAMVSPILGLTIQSIRRAVVEVRLAVQWLRQRGYRHIGLLGTSLGSCIGFLALAHDEDLKVAALNHVAGEFADVVWSGLATQHVRASLDQHIDLETLRRCWAPISPVHFAARLLKNRPKLLMISGAYDPIFLPAHSQALVDALDRANVDFRRLVLPCGHYTLGRPPFYLIDAYLIVRFFRRHLG
ncbi:MAG: abhydrolase domain-containing 18 [Acidobacteriota bacterium]|nr:alpha/beta hydrolase [Acidobacteriota bacterium]MEC8944523.1 abhydrolase domain-containing 18 [Acidobacteriota bacterium]|tara:strand:+ start:11810 stop:12820 length:1011 start_codon:yes stop_codon:yes gene_type:complete